MAERPGPKDIQRVFRWDSFGLINSVRLDYSIDSGTNWQMIVERVPNSGEYLWTIPDVETDSALVSVTDADDFVCVFEYIELELIILESSVHSFARGSTMSTGRMSLRFMISSHPALRRGI